MNKKLKYVLLTTVTAITLSFSAQMLSDFNRVNAQEIAQDAAKKVTSKNVEMIKSQKSDGNYSVHYRDKANLTEVTEEYVNNELQRRIIVSESGKKVTSIGRDFETNQLKGSTWTLPPNIAAENKRLLNTSLLEDVKKGLENNNWQSDGEEILSATGKKVKKLKTQENDTQIIVSIDSETGLPVKREYYKKDQSGKWVINDEQEERYEYLISIPTQQTSTNDVQIKEIAPPIRTDEVLPRG